MNGVNKTNRSIETFIHKRFTRRGGREDWWAGLESTTHLIPDIASTTFLVELDNLHDGLWIFLLLGARDTALLE